MYERSLTLIYITMGELVFTFLDLPVELRLMVYECLSIRTSHAPVKTSETDAEIELVAASIPVISILATCRRIYEEALPIPQPVRASVESEPLRMIVKSPSISSKSLRKFLELVLQDTSSTRASCDQPRRSCSRKAEHHKLFMANTPDFPNKDFSLRLEIAIPTRPEDSEDTLHLRFYLLGQVIGNCLPPLEPGTLSLIYLRFVLGDSIDV
ncbi:hypothetical protein P154DRAFT_321887 [Amniculicola lignicola CBS 123094]|uniref:F-box domain-containing protein n=1 Tax=Amniculicola lignicola CBS 123094 TaxID=1392246 RepID=A0A6A5W5L9_9PLEO|nr:hypothetical protein P154DRAFT_321887 [Amniculicola lignicola CBS 123094]